MSVSSMLRGHNIFRMLTTEEVDRISGSSSEARYQRGEVVFRTGDPANHVFLLIEGSVCLRSQADEPVGLAVARIEKGEVFGLSPLLGSERYTAAAQCEGPSQILAINARTLREILLANPIAGMQIMSGVAEEYFDRYLDLVKRLQAIAAQMPLVV